MQDFDFAQIQSNFSQILPNLPKSNQFLLRNVSPASMALAAWTMLLDKLRKTWGKSSRFIDFIRNLRKIVFFV